MRLNKASGLNASTTGTLRTLYFHPLPGTVGHSHAKARKFIQWGERGDAFCCTSPMPTVPMGAIGGDKPAWMGAIEINHFGPVFTHNPPRPSQVTDVGWWQGGGGRQWGAFASVCLDGLWLYNVMPFPSRHDPFCWLFCLSICLQLPWHHLDIDTFLILSLHCHRAVLIMLVQASSTVLCVYIVLTIRPVRGLLTVTPAPTTFTWRDSRISNQGHQHLGEFNSFQPPCSLNSRSWAHTVHLSVVHLSGWLRGKCLISLTETVKLHSKTYHAKINLFHLKKHDPCYIFLNTNAIFFL